MDAWLIASASWPTAVDRFFQEVDSLPHHFLMHLIHGAEILGYEHPDDRFRSRWHDFYLTAVDDLHLREEAPHEMRRRLSDWGRSDWGV